MQRSSLLRISSRSNFQWIPKWILYWELRSQLWKPLLSVAGTNTMTKATWGKGCEVLWSRPRKTVWNLEGHFLAHPFLEFMLVISLDANFSKVLCDCKLELISLRSSFLSVLQFDSFNWMKWQLLTCSPIFVQSRNHLAPKSQFCSSNGISLCSSGWPGTYCVDQASHRLRDLPPACWDERYVLLHLACLPKFYLQSLGITHNA